MEIIERLDDLIKQATEERSHYYVRRVAEDSKAEIALLRRAVTRYCDRSRMGTVEPMDLQQAIDRAFQAEH